MNLAPALAELGEVEVQKLSKRHLDDLVTALRAGGLASRAGKLRKSVFIAIHELHAGPTHGGTEGRNAAGVCRA